MELPENLQSLPFQTSQDIHGYNTSQAGNIHILKIQAPLC